MVSLHVFDVEIHQVSQDAHLVFIKKNPKQKMLAKEWKHFFFKKCRDDFVGVNC